MRTILASLGSKSEYKEAFSEAERTAKSAAILENSKYCPIIV